MSTVPPRRRRTRAPGGQAASLAERRRSSTRRRAREAVTGGVGVALVALDGDLRLAMRAAKVMLEDSSPGRRLNSSSVAPSRRRQDRLSLDGRGR